MMMLLWVVHFISLHPLASSTSPLAGLLVSHPTEYEDLSLTKTSGSPPMWLKGFLYRTGPGLFEYGARSVNNVIDGLSKIHSWNFLGDGSVNYTAKMIKSGIYNKTLRDGEYAALPVMGDPVPDFSLSENLAIMMGGTAYADNTNIAIWNLDKSKTVTVCGESPQMNQVHRINLDFEGSLPSPALKELNISIFSASHFSPHPTDGSSFNYVFNIKYGFNYSFYQYTSSDDGSIQTRFIGSIPTNMSDIRIVHTFGVTESYLVVPRWNNKIELLSMLDPYNYTHLCNVFKFVYDKPFHVEIMSIATGKLYSFELPVHHGVHIMNTFERRNPNGEREVVMDYPTLTDTNAKDLNKYCLFDIMKIPYLNDPEFMYSENPWWDYTLRRFIFNLDTGKYTITDFPRAWEFVDSSVELPYINPEYRGKDYCFVYFQQWNIKEMSMSLLKYDVCEGKLIRWHEPNKHVSEPVYAPNPNSVREDDGVVVAPVFDSSSNTTELYVWNSTNLSVLAIYDNRIPVPFTIHGLWFDEA